MTAPLSPPNAHENSPPINRYWIGGSPCSGKSSIAKALASNLTTYHCDDYFPEHLQRANPQSQPAMSRLPHMTCDDIWLEPVEAQVQHVFQIYGEEFAMIMDDLQQLAGHVIVEGAALIPGLVHPFIENLDHCIFLIPSCSFQIKYYSQREWHQDVVKECSHPTQAFANWMERDQQFGEEIRRDALKHGFTCLTVDESDDLDYYIERVADHFALR